MHTNNTMRLGGHRATIVHTLCRLPLVITGLSSTHSFRPEGSILPIKVKLVRFRLNEVSFSYPLYMQILNFIIVNRKRVTYFLAIAYLAQGHKQIPQHFSMLVRCFSALWRSAFISSRLFSMLSSCSDLEVKVWNIALIILFWRLKLPISLCIV